MWGMFAVEIELEAIVARDHIFYPNIPILQCFNKIAIPMRLSAPASHAAIPYKWRWRFIVRWRIQKDERAIVEREAHVGRWGWQDQYLGGWDWQEVRTSPQSLIFNYGLANRMA